MHRVDFFLYRTLENMLEFIETIKHQFYITFIYKDRYEIFIEGFGNTLLIAFTAVLIGVAIGSLVAIVRVYNRQSGKLKIINGICGAYLAIFRGTPVIVQLMIVYYIIFVSYGNALLAAIITFGFNSGAYVAEIIRAGILAVDIGQLEAGESLGLPYKKTMRLIIMPQAIKNILPALGNEFVVLVKETSVAGYITVMDLARAGDYSRSRTMEPFFSLIFTAIVYFLLVFGISYLIKKLERRLRKSDRG